MKYKIFIVKPNTQFRCKVYRGNNKSGKQGSPVLDHARTKDEFRTSQDRLYRKTKRYYFFKIPQGDDYMIMRFRVEDVTITYE